MPTQSELICQKSNSKPINSCLAEKMFRAKKRDTGAPSEFNSLSCEAEAFRLPELHVLPNDFTFPIQVVPNDEPIEILACGEEYSPLRLFA